MKITIGKVSVDLNAVLEGVLILSGFILAFLLFSTLIAKTNLINSHLIISVDPLVLAYLAGAYYLVRH